MELYIYDFSNDRKQQQRAIHTHCITGYKPNPYTVMKYICDRMYEQIRKTKSIAARHPLAMSLYLFFSNFQNRDNGHDWPNDIQQIERYADSFSSSGKGSHITGCDVYYNNSG